MLKNVWTLSKDFFLGEMKWYAFAMLLGALVFEAGFVYILVKVAHWSRDIYNALDNLDYKAFIELMYRYVYLFIAILLVSAIKVFIALSLMLKWREWMTSRYLDKWLNKASYYGCKLIGNEVDNPDQRISEDVKNFTSNVLNLTISLVSVVMTLTSFSVMLWFIVDPFEFTLWGIDFKIHGYLFWIAFFYALISSFIAHYFGKPFSALFFRQEKKEANFRYGMMRLREYSESIAFYHAEKFEKKNFSNLFYDVVENTRRIIKRQIIFGVFRSIQSFISSPLILLVLAPYYFAKKITLGVFFQAQNAFDRVRDSFEWFVDSYITIATLRAEVDRLMTFKKSLETWEKERKNRRVKISTHSGAGIVFKNLEINLPNKTSLVKAHNIDLKTQNCFFSAPSGSGKSTTLRAIAGFWPYTKGEILIPKNKSIMYVAQKSFMPNSSLLEAIFYPNIQTDVKLAEKLLKGAGLNHLVELLHHKTDWARHLSGGEQQKIAILRVIVNKPNIVFLDESFNSMDKQSRIQIYELLAKELPKAQLISIAHYSDIEKYHKQVLSIEKGELALSKI